MYAPPTPPPKKPDPRPWDEPPLAYVDDGQPVWCYVGDNRWRPAIVVVAAGDHARVQFGKKHAQPFRWVPIDALRARSEGAA